MYRVIMNQYVKINQCIEQRDIQRERAVVERAVFKAVGLLCGVEWRLVVISLQK